MIIVPRRPWPLVGVPLIPWKLVAETDRPGGAKLALWRRDFEGRLSEFSLRILEPNTPTNELMNSRQHRSEKALAELAIKALGRDAKSALVGGLGMGFTLRAALDGLQPGARVTVAELYPEVVTWNREHMGDLAGRPLDDQRVSVHLGDVAELLRVGKEQYDLILLDTDYGPEGTDPRDSKQLYSDAGLTNIRARLTPGGVLSVWSALESPGFIKRLERSGLAATVERPRAHGKSGTRHTVWLAKRR